MLQLVNLRPSRLELVIDGGLKLVLADLVGHVAQEEELRLRGPEERVPEDPVQGDSLFRVVLDHALDQVLRLREVSQGVEVVPVLDDVAYFRG